MHSVYVHGSNAQNHTKLLFNDCIFNYGSEVNTFNLLTSIYESIQNLSLSSGSSSALDPSVLTDLLSAFEVLDDSINSSADDIEASLSSIEDFLSGTLMTTVRQLNSKLSSINTNTTNIKNSLSSLVTYLDEVESYLLTIDFNLTTATSRLLDIRRAIESCQSYISDCKILLSSIDNKLSHILNALVGTTNPSITKPDISQFDDYNNLEGSLLNPSNISDDAFSVSYNQNSFSLIFGQVHEFLNLNPKVFMVTLSVLSLGLIVLVIGRRY